MNKFKPGISLTFGLVFQLLLFSTSAWASKIDTNKVTPTQALDETCLDSKTVPKFHHVTLDKRGWHKDNFYKQWGLHVTFSIYKDENTKIDTLHIYQEKNDTDNCLITCSQKKYTDSYLYKGDGYCYVKDTSKM